MTHIRPLPGYLIQRFHGWRATTYQDNRAWYRRLAESGQHPRAMVISCCDSRVHVTSIFGADEGEFFIHRNIANLVPPYTPDGERHGTSAAVEYAVTSLGVAHIVVLGPFQLRRGQGLPRHVPRPCPRAGGKDQLCRALDGYPEAGVREGRAPAGRGNPAGAGESRPC
jgi:hypothetical protein